MTFVFLIRGPFNEQVFYIVTDSRVVSLTIYYVFGM